MNAHGFLVATMEPDPHWIEEFNAWYDLEHVPEREAVEGFLKLQRYVCVDGWPRYMAFYDLESLDVIDRASYRSIAGEHYSPWSKRVFRRATGQYRAVGHQLFPGEAVIESTHPFARATLLIARAAGEAPDGLAGRLDELQSACGNEAQIRLFQSRADGPSDLISMIEHSGAEESVRRVVEAWGVEGVFPDICNTYVKYFNSPLF